MPTPRFSLYRKNILLLSALNLLLIVFITSPLQARKQPTFPSYPAIATNITFWKKIYSDFSVNTAILHDKKDLNIIYTILYLHEKNVPGAESTNNNTIKKSKEKFTLILQKLSKGVPPSTKDEKRVAALFKGPTARERMARAIKTIRIQRGLKEQFRDGVIRSGAYLESIKHIFHSYKLPTDLAYLPHVESSFNINAYSKFGATGIWQFTRSTGKEFMVINEVIDERRDPIISTHAAAKFLQKNHQILGTWPLAITAYNYGAAGMRRAVVAKKHYPQIFSSYSEGYFKFAARNFYAEFLAAVNIAKKLEKNTPPQLHSPQITHSLRLRGYAHIKDICNHFKLSPSTLQKLNPSLQKSIFNGEKYIPKGFLLRLPSDTLRQQLLNKVPPAIYKSRQQTRRVYRVKRGDTAGKIAITYSIPLKRLIFANNLNRNATIFVGQKLRIPSRTAPLSSQPQLITTSGFKRKYGTLTLTPPTSSQIPIILETKKLSPL